MALAFINYLTGDGDGIAVLLDRELSRTFGPDTIFRAGRSIPAGEHWEATIHAALRRSRALIAVIGPRWLATLYPAEASCRHIRWTEWEIQTALTAGLQVIPVLIDQTPRLSTENLPPTLTPLAKRPHLRLQHDDVDPAIERLTAALARPAS